MKQSQSEKFLLDYKTRRKSWYHRIYGGREIHHCIGFVSQLQKAEGVIHIGGIARILRKIG